MIVDGNAHNLPYFQELTGDPDVLPAGLKVAGRGVPQSSDCYVKVNSPEADSVD